jgi:4-hydroxy-4-methyl-2-oxoglutarate aldolase
MLDKLPPRDEITARLYTAVLSDTLDSIGLTHGAMKPFVRPLDDRLVLFGPARTGLYMPRYHVEVDRNPYEIEMRLIDDLRTGEVAVFACGGPTDRIAPWGELLSTASQVRGAAGCVTDGLVRDVRQIRQMGFPVFHGGIGPLDSKGRGEMVAMDVPVELAGVRVEPGDFVFGDVDGVVLIPKAAVLDVIGAALAKVAAEDRTRDELRNGAKLADVYAKYGVL